MHFQILIVEMEIIMQWKAQFTVIVFRIIKGL